MDENELGMNVGYEVDYQKQKMNIKKYPIYIKGGGWYTGMEGNQRLPAQFIGTSEGTDFIDAVKHWTDEHPVNSWVSVKDRVPDLPQSKYDYENRFLVTRKGGSMAFIAIYHKDGKWYIPDHMQYTEIVAPDYWMPIPELPKGDKE